MVSKTRKKNASSRVAKKTRKRHTLKSNLTVETECLLLYEGQVCGTHCILSVLTIRSILRRKKKQYRDFICSLQYVLPCKYCRMNLKNNFKSLPPTMEVMKNRTTFSRYIFDLHRLINKMLKKKSNLTFCEVQDRYEHFRARYTRNPPSLWKLKNIKKTAKATVKSKNVKEKGCTEPLYTGEKSKCIIKIVPQTDRSSTFQMDKKCKKKLVK